MKLNLFLNGSLVVLALWGLGTGSSFGQCAIDGPDNTCAGQSVPFEVGNPEPGRTYEWDFNEDGQVDARGISVTHRFPGATNARNFEVTLLRDGAVCATREINVSAGPDASLGVNPADGTLEDGEIRVCTKEKRVTVGFFNTSTTVSINESYEIAWGDGSVDVFDNSTFTSSRLVEHTYREQGYKEITLRVRSRNGCVAEKKYLFYYGGNPSVGLVNPGNTTGLCVGESLTFPISETSGNPDDTQYEIFINDQMVDSYTQANVPGSYTYTFDESSCGLTTPSANFKHAFEVKILARTPCGTSSATIAPIEVSAPPELDLTIDAPSSSCVGQTFKFKNTSSTQEINSSGTATQCLTELDASWAIEGPGDFNVINGNVFSSESLEVTFDVPGTYGITVTVTSSVCGAFSLTDSIEVSRETRIQQGDIALDFDGANACAPSVVDIVNRVQNADEYDWKIEPASGWNFASGSKTSRTPSIEFTEGGDYVIRLRASNNCRSDTWRDTIQVRGAPSVDLDFLPDACEQTVLDFDQNKVGYRDNGPAISDYDWSFPGSVQGTSGDQFPDGIVYNSPGTYTVTASATNNCGTGSDSRTFTIESPIDATIPDTVLLCGNGDPVSLSATPSGGDWSGTGVSADGDFDPKLAAIGDNFLYYEVGIGSCADRDTALVRLLPYPLLDLGPDRSICITEDTLELIPNLTGGTWQSLNGGQLDSNLFLPAASGQGTYSLRYEFTNADACTSADTLALEVVGEVDLVVNDTLYCNIPGTFDLPVPNLAGGTWSGPGVSGASFSPQAAGGQGIYQVEYDFQDPAFCPTTAQIAVTVDSLPLVDAGPGDSLCISETEVRLRGLPAGGEWSGPGIDPARPEIFQPALVGPGRFDLYYIYGEGSCRVRDSTRITLLDNPNVFAGPDRQVCADDSSFVLLGNTPVGGEWSGPGIVNSFSGEFDPTRIPIGTSELVYSYTFPGVNCFGRDTIQVSKRPLPSAIFEPPTTYCVLDSLTIIDQSIGAYEWRWDFDNGQRSVKRNPSAAFDSAGLYRIRLTVESDFGCTDTTSRLLEVLPPPAAAFTLDADKGCAPVSVNFTNRSVGDELEYEWDFGNGDTSSQALPGRVTFVSAPRDTIFEVRLKAINQCGEDLYVDTVQVLTVPTVNFGFSVDTSCSPVATQISNLTSGGIVDVFWDLGNGNVSTDFDPPEQVYRADDQPITYDITLRASNACGEDSLTRPLYVKPANVEAFISLPQTSGCAPLTMDFANFTTIGSRLVWDFGDGTTSNQLTPTHTWEEPGNYRVIQYAENGCGVDSTSTVISVMPSPEVAFDLTSPACINSPLSFENLSSGADGFEWRFDSLGSSSLKEPVFSFPEPGTYTISLEGTSADNGCSTVFSQQIWIREIPDIRLDLDLVEGCEPLTVSFTGTSNRQVAYQWDFGDGNSSAQKDPEHLFGAAGRYEVTVSAIDSTGCRQTTEPTLVTVRPRPQLSIDPVMEEECTLPARVAMQAESQNADTYDWDFGNGSGSTLNNPVGVYPEPGVYDIFLKAENIYGCVDSVTGAIQVPVVPVADFTLEPREGCSPLEVRFTNFSTNADRYLWAFGDGRFSAETDPVHFYYDQGLYDVQLIASANDICKDTFSLPGAIQVYRTPHASFEVLPVEVGPFDGTFIFNNLSEGADVYFWDFGDGTTSREFSPQHQFQDDASRQIYLEAVGDNGCKDDTLVVLRPPAIKGLHIPTGFSPQNGLGDVRVFKPTGIGLKEYRLQVFSSYGELLWETQLLEDGQPVESWDGTVNGQLQPQDVYVWKCRAVFEDGTVWAGQKDASGRIKNIGSLVLLR